MATSPADTNSRESASMSPREPISPVDADRSRPLRPIEPTVQHVYDNANFFVSSGSVGSRRQSVAIQEFHQDQFFLHAYIKKSFSRPTYCHHCNNMLWGLRTQGYMCIVCNFVSHDRCTKFVMVPCFNSVRSFIKDPRPHCWSEPVQLGRCKRMCNVCRKRIDDEAFVCELCDYYSHPDCAEFVPLDCRVTASYLSALDDTLRPVNSAVAAPETGATSTPTAGLTTASHLKPSLPSSSETATASTAATGSSTGTPGSNVAASAFLPQYHHWKEGNLPAGSKCTVCKRPCYSTECLYGYMCLWCQMAVHVSCHLQVGSECDLGPLREIKLPPSCLTMARIDTDPDSTFGVIRRRVVTKKSASGGTVEKEHSSGGLDGGVALGTASQGIAIDGASQGGVAATSRPPEDDYAFGRADSQTPVIGGASVGPTGISRRSSAYKESTRDDVYFRVYDGDEAIRTQDYRTIRVTRSDTGVHTVTLCHRAYGMYDDPMSYQLFFIFDIMPGELGTDWRSERVEMDEKLLTSFAEKRQELQKIPSLLLRADEKAPSEWVRVHIGCLSAPVPYVKVRCNELTTTADLMERALRKLNFTRKPARSDDLSKKSGSHAPKDNNKGTGDNTNSNGDDDDAEQVAGTTPSASAMPVIGVPEESTLSAPSSPIDREFRETAGDNHGQRQSRVPSVKSPPPVRSGPSSIRVQRSSSNVQRSPAVDSASAAASSGKGSVSTNTTSSHPTRLFDPKDFCLVMHELEPTFNPAVRLRVAAANCKDTSRRHKLLEALQVACGELPASDGGEVRDFRNIDAAFPDEATLFERPRKTALHPNARILPMIRALRRESVVGMHMTRLFVQQRSDPHGERVTIFVGGLPRNYTQRHYAQILSEILASSTNLRWDSIDVIYYEYGSLVLVYKDADRAQRAYDRLHASRYDGKSLVVLVLPNIQPHMIPDGVVPLCVFVNAKSGGCQGADLIRHFRYALNPHQVFNMDFGGPLPGLYMFRSLRKFKILACGGDGTVGWVLSCLDNVGQDAVCPNPPIAILPLGTGNDLARVLDWGRGFTGGEDLIELLQEVILAQEVRLDRFTVIVRPDEKEIDERKCELGKKVGCQVPNEDVSRMSIMNNYFGIGLDAEVALEFHEERCKKPEEFTSRIYSQTVYVKKSLKRLFKIKGATDNLYRQIQVEVDGRPLELPHSVSGLILLNIPSWASGANPWGNSSESDGRRWKKPAFDDGLLEVIGVTSVVNLGLIQSGTGSGIRLAQCGNIRIKMLSTLPVQVDGEPWTEVPDSMGLVIVADPQQHAPFGGDAAAN